MNKWMAGIRWKIIMLFFLSVGLAAGSAVLLYVSVLWLENRDVVTLSYPVRNFVHAIGLVPIISGTTLIFFVFYVVLLSWRHLRYLVQITDSIKKISLGTLDQPIPVKTRDELGQLAEHINRMASQLQETIEEERLAVKAKNELITNVSHDLRTPLTSILGYLQLIDQDKYKDEVELKYYVDIAYEKSQRLNRLVNDLFAYTRMNYGQITLARAEIDLLELIGQLAADFSLQLREANLELRLNLPEHKMRIIADGDKMMQALENLISNAIKYGKAGQFVDIVVTEESDYAIVRVINYGQPIPSTDIPHLFDRFYRVEKSRSDETGGTGLGLAIVKSIIELHDGSIHVTSDDRATAFEVKLPFPLSNT